MERLTLEMRHQQPSVAPQCPAGHPRRAVQAEHPGRARFEVDAVLVDRRGDDLADQIGPAGHHADARGAHRKQTAIAAGVATQGGVGVAQVTDHLQQPKRRAGRQAADQRRCGCGHGIEVCMTGASTGFLGCRRVGMVSP
jgi:hypothetical protein